MIGLSIFLFSATSGSKIGNAPTVLDFFLKNGGHVFGFYLFAGILCLAITTSLGLHVPTFKTKITAIIFAVIVASLSEGIQIFVPDRTPSLFDFAFDSIGIIIGALAATKWRQITK